MEPTRSPTEGELYRHLLPVLDHPETNSSFRPWAWRLQPVNWSQQLLEADPARIGLSCTVLRMEEPTNLRIR